MVAAQHGAGGTGGRAARASPASEPRPAVCITGSRAMLLFKPFNGRNTEPGSMPRQPATPPTRRHLLAEPRGRIHHALGISPSGRPPPAQRQPRTASHRSGCRPARRHAQGFLGSRRKRSSRGSLLPWHQEPGVVAPGVLVPTETTQHTLLVLTRAVQTQPVLSAFPAPLAFGVGVLLLGKTCGCSSVSPPARAKCLRGQPQSTLINPANILDLSYSTAS